MPWSSRRAPAQARGVEPRALSDLGAPCRPLERGVLRSGAVWGRALLRFGAEVSALELPS